MDFAYLESRFRPDAISYKNGQPCALGLMQFTRETARRYGLTNPHNAREAINAAGRYVRDLMMRFDGRVDLVLAAYNAGEGAVEAFRAGKKVIVNGKIINPRAIRTGGVPPYSETENYVSRGISIFKSIRRLPGTISSQSVWTNQKPVGRRKSLYVSDQQSEKSTRAAFSLYAN